MSERCGTCGAFRLEAGAHGLSNLPTCPECGAHQTTETTRAPFEPVVAGGAPAPPSAEWSRTQAQLEELVELREACAQAAATLDNAGAPFGDGTLTLAQRIAGLVKLLESGAGGAPAVPSELTVERLTGLLRNCDVVDPGDYEAWAKWLLPRIGSLAPAPSGPAAELTQEQYDGLVRDAMLWRKAATR